MHKYIGNERYAMCNSKKKKNECAHTQTAISKQIEFYLVIICVCVF